MKKYICLLAVLLLAGCADKVVNVTEEYVYHIDDGDNDGLVRVPPSSNTGSVAIVANLTDGSLQPINKNDETIGVRIYRDSSSVLLSDGLIGAGESGRSENIFLEYEVEYSISVRFYEFNFLDIITNIFGLFGQEAGWTKINSVYIRQEYNSTVIFHA